ncbi:MAG: PspA/IM30 family protein [Spirochaetota bacterium]|nr:PspA/IM30 family protein [Spirochaetota bacterium]
MGIFDRIVTVVKSNINELISKAEDPKKMLEQIIMDMNESLAEVKKEVASAIADEKRLQKSYLTAKQESDAWEKKAMLAVNKGDDGLAMEALKRQESSLSLSQQYEQQWIAQKDSVDKLKVALTQLNDKIQEAQRKKNLLIARQKRAEAQSKITKTMSSLTDSSAFDSFARMEAKVDQIEAEAEAGVELQSELAGSDLDNKFKALEMDGGAEDKLAALKAKMGKQ